MYSSSGNILEVESDFFIGVTEEEYAIYPDRWDTIAWMWRKGLHIQAITLVCEMVCVCHNMKSNLTCCTCLSRRVITGESHLADRWILNYQLEDLESR